MFEAQVEPGQEDNDGDSFFLPSVWASQSPGWESPTAVASAGSLLVLDLGSSQALQPGKEEKLGIEVREMVKSWIELTPPWKAL